MIIKLGVVQTKRLYFESNSSKIVQCFTDNKKYISVYLLLFYSLNQKVDIVLDLE